MSVTVAAFDVDGTVTDRDCVIPFMRRVTPGRRIAARLAVRPDRIIPALSQRDRDQLKALAAAAAFRGLRVDDLTDAGSEFARLVHARWLRRDIVDLLDDHRTAGDRVVLVSASFEVYLRPLGELLGVDGVLATRLQMDDGVATGALDGENCRGAEKVRRLHRWLDATVGGRDCAHLVAYGDSMGDREMLADADRANWVNARSAR